MNSKYQFDFSNIYRPKNTKSTVSDKWSGDATKYTTQYGYTDTSISVSMNEEQKKEKEAPKQQPIWMKKSTVDGVPTDVTNEVNKGFIFLMK